VRVRLGQGPYDLMEALYSATVSPDQQYRYLLGRQWDASKPNALFVMLNPSIADGAVDDHTIRKCMQFSRNWGCGGIEVVNLFALRATDPRTLVKAYGLGINIEGEDNDAYTLGAMQRATDKGVAITCAWGSTKGARPKLIHHRIEVVKALAHNMGARLECLGRAKGGDPRHPLMLSYSVGTESWP